MPARRDAITLVSIATAVAAIDQLTKSVLVSAIRPGPSSARIDFLGGWMAIEYTENRGAAFGLFSGLAPILVVASVVILVGLLLHYSRQTRPPLWETVAIGSIAGGAIGNLVDRVRLGYVVDFVSVGPWPNFNVADSAITIGVVMLIWGWMRSELRWGAARAIDREGTWAKDQHS